jgi:xanthine dehydrogenase accessory factor
VTERARQETDSDRAHAVATVVRVDRPVSARLGDRAVITPDGRLDGWVGGSCSEPIVRREALAALSDGEPRLVRIRPVGGPREPRQPGVVTEVTTCASNGGLDVFVEPRMPRPRLAVAGSSPAARSLARLATTMGYRVVAVLAGREEALPHADESIDIATLTRLQLGPEDAVVVATMSRYDEDALSAALETGAGYIGLVASRPRGADVLAILRARGVAGEQLERVFTPAGLDLGPLSQDEIGLSVLAQVVRHRRRTRGERKQPLCPPDEDLPQVDPVCGMTVALVSSTPSSSASGTTFYFCSEHCRRAFEEEPERYVGRAVKGRA